MENTELESSLEETVEETVEEVVTEAAVEEPVSEEPVVVDETTEFAKKDEDEMDKDEQSDSSEIDNNVEEQNSAEVEETVVEEPVVETYSLDKIPEYLELQAQFSDLQSKYDSLVEANKELTEFKNGIERKQKEEMIDSFFMLSDEDKQTVKDNIDTYSLDDIEKELSVICVRNKVNFNLDEEAVEKPTVYNVNTSDLADATTPAWIKAALDVAESMK